MIDGDGGIGEVDGTVFHLLPGLEVVFESVFLLQVAERGEEKFADEGKVRGVAGRDAVLGDGFEELAENEIDVRGGHELTGDGRGQLGTEAVRFDNLALGTSVEDAESRVVFLTQHAASAAVGELELAERGFICGNAGTGLL